MTMPPAKNSPAKMGGLFFALTAVLFIVVTSTLIAVINKNAMLEEHLRASGAETLAVRATLERIKRNDLKELSAQLDDYKSRYERTVLENSRLTAKNFSMDVENKALKRSGDDLAGQMEEKDKLIELMKKKETESQGLAARLKDKEAESGTRTEALAKAEKEVERLSSEGQLLRSKLAQTQSRLDSGSLKKLQSEIQSLKKKLVSTVNQFAAFKKEASARPNKKFLNSNPDLLRDADRRLKELSAETAVTHYNLGVIYMREESYQQALEEFTYALERNPDDALAHYNLAVIYQFHLNKPREAIPHYEAYVRLSPHASDLKDVKYQIFHLNLHEQAGSGKDLFVDTAKTSSKTDATLFQAD